MVKGLLKIKLQQCHESMAHSTTQALIAGEFLDGTRREPERNAESVQ